MPGQMPVQLTAHAYSSSKVTGFRRVFAERDWGARVQAILCVRTFFRPFGLIPFPLLPRLTPLRQTQGKLWAAFCRRFAAEIRWFRPTSSPKI